MVAAVASVLRCGERAVASHGRCDPIVGRATVVCAATSASASGRNHDGKMRERCVAPPSVMDGTIGMA